MINNKRRMKCDFCSNMFGDAKMLRQHQTKTQYCLKIQAKIIVREKEAEAIEKAKLEVEAIEKAKLEAEAREKAKELSCQYCGKYFKNKYILHNHQIQVKYCLKIQESQNSQEIISSLVVCKYCTKNFSKVNFNIHDSTCKKKIQFFAEEIVKLKAEQEKEIYKLKVEKEKAEEIIKLKTEQEIYYKEEAILYQNTLVDMVKRNYYEYNSVIEIEQETESPEESHEEPYELVPLELENGYIIEHREEDGYINITDLCKAGGKQFGDWNRLDRTKAFIKALSTATGIPFAVLIQIGTGTKFGTTENTETNGTWVHPQVAINIAQWISPQFDVKVSAWVYEVMMTGKVDITNTKSYRELQQENKNKQLKIQIMTKKYVKKQPRLDIKERNVIYILTTQLMKKEGRYILGKATNLTNRLSTYNKTDEHEIVYYQECGDEDKMSLVESMVFNKIKEYREQANRERFVISNDKDITFFIDAIKECISFIK